MVSLLGYLRLLAYAAVAVDSDGLRVRVAGARAGLVGTCGKVVVHFAACLLVLDPETGCVEMEAVPGWTVGFSW